MNDSEIIRELGLERSTLQLKQQINDIKQTCVEMPDNEKGRRCLVETQEFESRVDQQFSPSQTHGQNPHPTLEEMIR